MSEENLLESQNSNSSDANASENNSENNNSESTFKDLMSDEGKVSEKYLEKYTKYDPDVDPEAFKNMMTSNGYDFNRIVKQNLSLEKMLGKDKVTFPGENGTEEDWAKFFVEVGAPDAEGEYKVSDAQKELMDEETLNGILAMGKAVHMPQALMDKVLPVLGASKKASDEVTTASAEEAKRDAIVAIEATFGRNGTVEFDGNINLAKKGLKILAVDNGIEDADSLIRKYGNDPFLLNVFRNKAVEGGENSAPVGAHGGGMAVVKGIEEKITIQQDKYWASKNSKDLELLMDLRNKKISYG